jgi:hypothetical protein
MKQLIPLILSFLILLTACSPTPAPTAAPQPSPPTVEPSIANTSTSTPTATPVPTDTTVPTDTPSPSETPETTSTITPSPSTTHYDTFISQISQHDARVEYSPEIIRPGDKLTATIFLPIETPGSHGLPFADVYDVTVEVYTRGGTEFDLGQFTGTRVSFTGDDLSGSSDDGFLILTWRSPTYSADVPYVYLFSIYPNASASRAKLALIRAQSGEPLQTITLSGLPDVTNQVSVEDWPTPEGDNPAEPEGGSAGSSAAASGTSSDSGSCTGWGCGEGGTVTD